MTKIIVFGSGISGLTIAHELVKKGFDVLVIEKDSIIGGMAKTRWENDTNVPSEHSWRGWGNFYSNTFRIMNEIPTDKNMTVYDNLTKEVDFYMVRDEVYKYKRNYSLQDYLVLINDCLQFLLSDKRKKYFYTLKASEYYKNKLSKDIYEFMLKFAQTAGFGMENKDGSVGHLLQFIILPLTHPYKYKNCHDNNREKYCSKSTDRWHLLNKPTNDGWFNPWKEYLETQGVQFMLNAELVDFTVNKYEVVEVNVKNTKHNSTQTFTADDYVFALNPFNLEEILKRSIPDSTIYNQFSNMNNKTISNQISFRIGIDKNISYPTNYIGIVLTDSEYNITFYPQNTHWNDYDKMNIPFQTLWSGTLMDSVTKGGMYNKSSIELKIEELKNEIVNQILKSKSLQKLIYDSNGFYIDLNDIKYVEIWYEWKYDPNKKRLVQDYKKWVNNIYNEEFRSQQKTNYKNLFLSGAHTKTSSVIYSMEGATESGLLTTNLILSKYNKKKVHVVKHNDPIWTQPFKLVDNILYSLKCPSIFIVMVLFMFINLYIRFN